MVGIVRSLPAPQKALVERTGMPHFSKNRPTSRGAFRRGFLSGLTGFVTFFEPRQMSVSLSKKPLEDDAAAIAGDLDRVIERARRSKRIAS